jgi:hypothetical protein
MRNFLLIGAALLLLGAVGCASEEEQRLERQAEQKRMWGDVSYMPDKALEMGEYAPRGPAVNTEPAATPAPAIVQASGKQ